MNIQKLQAAAKVAPHYRVTVGALEVIGAPGVSRWSFNYVVRGNLARNGRTAYGKRNAEDYLRTIGDAYPIQEVTFSAQRLTPEEQARNTADNERAIMIARTRSHVDMLRYRYAEERITKTARLIRAQIACNVVNGWSDTPRERNARFIQQAANELAGYLATARDEITSPRAAFRSLYGIARSYRGSK